MNTSGDQIETSNAQAKAALAQRTLQIYSNNAELAATSSRELKPYGTVALDAHLAFSALHAHPAIKDKLVSHYGDVYDSVISAFSYNQIRNNSLFNEKSDLGYFNVAVTQQAIKETLADETVGMLAGDVLTAHRHHFALSPYASPSVRRYIRNEVSILNSDIDMLPPVFPKPTALEKMEKIGLQLGNALANIEAVVTGTPRQKTTEDEAENLYYEQRAARFFQQHDPFEIIRTRHAKPTNGSALIL